MSRPTWIVSARMADYPRERVDLDTVTASNEREARAIGVSQMDPGIRNSVVPGSIEVREMKS